MIRSWWADPYADKPGYPGGYGRRYGYGYGGYPGYGYGYGGMGMGAPLLGGLAGGMLLGGVLGESRTRSCHGRA